MHTHNFLYGAHAGMENQYRIPMDQYKNNIAILESELYDINYQEKQA